MLKSGFKWFMFILGCILSLPVIILTRLEEIASKGKATYIYGGSKELLSICPTIIGIYMRKAFYWAVCRRVSPDAHFLFGSWLAHRETIIAPGASIGAYTFIGFANIERNVLMGARVSIISGKYQHGRPNERAENGHDIATEEDRPIHIGENTWIGQDATIMANIGKNCTIGAGSVVLNDVPDNTTVLGNPARRVNL
jgi:virginiamycin A acetyltransferase